MSRVGHVRSRESGLRSSAHFNSPKCQCLKLSILASENWPILGVSLLVLHEMFSIVGAELAGIAIHRHNKLQHALDVASALLAASANFGSKSELHFKSRLKFQTYRALGSSA
eukprot:3194481-Rhodomonas_salina.1